VGAPLASDNLHLSEATRAGHVQVQHNATIDLRHAEVAGSCAPGGPGESHPRAPTERNVTVSRHSALLI
jgi:hypothetical protein